MNHNDFFRAVKAGAIAPCYVLEGEEEYIKQKALSELRATVAGGDFASMNQVRLKDPPADELIAAADTIPFMADRRLVEVRDSAMLLSGKAKNYDEDASVRALTAYVQHLPETACIVFYVTGKMDNRKKLSTLLKKTAQVISFEPLTDAELQKWIAQELRRAGKEIDRETAQALYFRAGRDLMQLHQEIEKLIAYTGERAQVTAEDLAAVCIQTSEYKVFALSERLLSGHGGEAMALLETMLREGEERMLLLALLGRQCRQLLDARAMADAGDNGSAIARALGLYAGAATQVLSMARRYTIPQLQWMCSLCLSVEFAVKSGALAEEGSLESIMLQIMALEP